jgi:hypothetical protein
VEDAPHPIDRPWAWEVRFGRMRRTQPAVGDVVQFSLPDGRYAYGRVLRDASVAFYRVTTREPGKPPIGSRDYQFVVGVYADVLRSKEVPIVGRDPSTDVDDEWPPPYSVHHPLTGRTDRYERGSMRGATEDETRGLEPAAAWDLNHLVDRLMGVQRGN